MRRAYPTKTYDHTPFVQQCNLRLQHAPTLLNSSTVPSRLLLAPRSACTAHSILAPACHLQKNKKSKVLTHASQPQSAPLPCLDWRGTCVDHSCLAPRPQTLVFAGATRCLHPKRSRVVLRRTAANNPNAVLVDHDAMTHYRRRRRAINAEQLPVRAAV